MGSHRNRHFRRNRKQKGDWKNKGSHAPFQGGMNEHAQGSRKNLISDLQKKGLFIRSIVPDGNCLFRSCADQLFGDQNRYAEVRRNAVNYIRSHKKDYLPFMDQDSEPFEQYVNRMSHNGTWGGDLEINAISNYYKCNVVVFQDRRPNLELQGFPKENRVLQLAYFGSCHYNSVRGNKPVSLSSLSTKDNIVIRKDEEVEERKKGEKEGVKRKKVEEERKKEGEKRKKEEVRKMEMEEKRVKEEAEKRKKEEERWEKEKEARKMEMEQKRKKEEEEKKKKMEMEERKKEEEEKQKEEQITEENETKSETTSSKHTNETIHNLIHRNFMILKEVEKEVMESQHHHHHKGEWCGDLPFDSLIEPRIQSKLLWIEREGQLRTVLRFLTMKCPCHSGAYFKYCCYPKMKVCIRRKRYYLSKYRV